MPNVKCNNTGKALYCKECQHGKDHEPKVWQDMTDCRVKSKCSVTNLVCKCEEEYIELIN